MSAAEKRKTPIPLLVDNSIASSGVRRCIKHKIHDANGWYWDITLHIECDNSPYKYGGWDNYSIPVVDESFDILTSTCNCQYPDEMYNFEIQMPHIHKQRLVIHMIQKLIV